MTGSFSREEEWPFGLDSEEKACTHWICPIADDTRCSSRPFGGLTSKAVMMSHTS